VTASLSTFPSTPPSEREGTEPQSLASGFDFRRLLDRFRDGIAVVGETRILYVNQAFPEYLGYQSSKAFARDGFERLLERHVSPSDDKRALHAFESVREGRDVHRRGEYHLQTLNGRHVAAELSFETVTSHGRPAILVTLRDLTEQQAIRQRLQNADRLTSLGTLAAGVAHEVNNPLAYVVTNLRYSIERLLRLRGKLPGRPELDPETRAWMEQELTPICEALEEAGDGTDRVARIVQGLKSFSRSSDEGIGPVDVHQVLEVATNMAENQIRYRARLIQNFGDIPLVEANESRLVQVFVNLLLNAAQAIPDGHSDDNSITLTTKVGPTGRVVVEVTDTGQGIPTEHLERIFDPFFTTKPVGVGTGLGLSICHGLLGALGGQIIAKSRVGRGATFRVELPAAPRDDSKKSRSPSVLPAPGRARVLVVDDEPLIVRSIVRLLCDEHEVTAAQSGAEALRLIAAGNQYDLILCDLMMPQMTGMEFHARLRTLDPAQAQRIVFLTGGAFTPNAQDYLKSVNTPMLEKPLEPNALKKLLASRES
jgi:PAS domain S-box-containing protein